jgi:hypothetical protein
MDRGVASVLVLAMILGGASQLQAGCAEQAQAGDSVSDERITAAVAHAPGDEDVIARLGKPETIVVRSSEVLASGGDVGVALFPGACAWPAGNPLPLEVLYPSGVLTWALRSGTVFQKGHFCEFGKARLIMQSDGNLVVYDETNRVRWASDTAGTGHHARYLLHPRSEPPCTGRRQRGDLCARLAREVGCQHKALIHASQRSVIGGPNAREMARVGFAGRAMASLAIVDFGWREAGSADTVS